MRKNGAGSHFDACCIMHCSLPASVNSPVATIGFAHSNLLHFWRGVWCAWGLEDLPADEYIYGIPNPYATLVHQGVQSTQDKHYIS